MKAVYYNIRSLMTDEIVDEGIVNDINSLIQPAINTGIIELPYQCRLFELGSRLNGFSVETIHFTITKESIIKLANRKRIKK